MNEDGGSSYGSEGEKENELVGSNSDQKNWRGIAIALLVIVIICSLIAVAVVIVTPDVVIIVKGDPVTYEDLFDPDYKARDFKVQWFSDGHSFVYSKPDGTIAKYDAKSAKDSVLMDNSTVNAYDDYEYYVSADEHFVLIAHNIKPVFRRSFEAEYLVYDVDLRISTPISVDDDGQPDRLQFAQWSPVGHQLVFVYKNNIYYKTDPKSDSFENVTKDGIPDLVFNGVPDWMNEEEILQSNNAIWWSKSGKYLCYAKYDDTNVPQMTISRFGSIESFYGEPKTIAYPKAGAVNPTVSLFVVNFENNGKLNAPTLLKPPQSLHRQSLYVKSVTWRNNERVAVTWLNRAHNLSVVTSCDAMDGDCKTIETLTTTSNSKKWIEMNSTPLFSAIGNFYFVILPHHVSKKKVPTATLR